jgi:NhaP-type Na+/H+ or K+/H+ antiporter
MTPLLAFALVLFAAVLAARLAERTAASISVLFIVAGFVFGLPGMPVRDWPVGHHGVELLARAALVAVLFNDGMRLGLKELRQTWQLPGRALLLGLPITLLAIAALAHWVAGFGWLASLLLGAVLTPTDPVFASALVDRAEIALPLRRLLNVESGVNDGIALPIVMLLIQAMSHESLRPGRLVGEVLAGIALGLVLPWVARALRPNGMEIPDRYRPLYGLSVGLTAVALARALGVNEFLATFLAGVSMATCDPELRDAYEPLGVRLGDLLKLATLLVFGASVSWPAIASLGGADFLFVALVLLVARPAGLLPSLLHTRLDLAQRFVAGVFGPKGFATLIYAVLVLQAGVPYASRVFHLSALVVIASIVLHSSADVPIAHWLGRRRKQQAHAEPRAGHPAAAEPH